MGLRGPDSKIIDRFGAWVNWACMDAMMGRPVPTKTIFSSSRTREPVKAIISKGVYSGMFNPPWFV